MPSRRRFFVHVLGRSAALAARLGCVREGGFTHAQFGATSIWRHPAPDAQGAGMEAYA